MQPVDLLFNALHLEAEFLQPFRKQVFSLFSVEQIMYVISDEIGDAAGSSDKAQRLESRIFIVGKSNTDHACTNLKYRHSEREFSISARKSWRADRFGSQDRAAGGLAAAT